MKSKPMLCIAMMLLLQNCEKALDRQYKKSLDESGEQKVIDAEDELQGSLPLIKPYESGEMKIWADRSEKINGGENLRFSGHVRILISDFQLIDAFEDSDSSVTIDIKSGTIIEKHGAFQKSEILGKVR